MTARIAIVVIVLLGVHLPCRGASAPPARNPQTVVLGSKQYTRVRSSDLIYLHNGDVLSEKLVSETITLATPYGILAVPVRRCAGISFEGDQIERQGVVTESLNRIAGSVEDPVVQFRSLVDSLSPPTAIARKEIKCIVVRYWPDGTESPEGRDKADLFVMANGDLLSGEIVERTIEIRTSQGTTSVSLADVTEIRMRGDPNDDAVITKTSGDVLRGTLETQALSLDLEIGLHLSAIPADTFAKILVDQADQMGPVEFAAQERLAVQAARDVAFSSVQEYERFMTIDLGEGVTMRLALIPPGTFLMGSPTDEPERFPGEGPQREVTISRPFYMGIYEVTNSQYKALMGYDPMLTPTENFSLDPSRPVTRATWEKAKAFCWNLSQKVGKKVTLPTEAQWEYACRAGSTRRFHFGDDERLLGNYAVAYGTRHPDIDNRRPARVGSKRPNAWGLYDMHGNVLEWCSDWYARSYVNMPRSDPKGPPSGESHVLRGGSHVMGPRYCRSACRNYGYADTSSGFRVVLDPSAAPEKPEEPKQLSPFMRRLRELDRKRRSSRW